MYVIYYKLLFELYMLKFDQFLTFVTCHVQHKRPVPTLSQTLSSAYFDLERPLSVVTPLEHTSFLVCHKRQLMRKVGPV